MKPKIISAYLDESGDFDVEGGRPMREPWVVGGMLVEADNRLVSTSLLPAIKSLVESIGAKPWFTNLHAKAKREILYNTDLSQTKQQLLQELVDVQRNPLLLHRASFVEALRRYDPASADSVLDEIDSSLISILRQLLPRPQLLAVVHRGRKSTHSPTNYAVLVQELVSIVCNDLASRYLHVPPPTLQFIIARRRHSDHQEWVHGLNSDQLKIAIANGLANAGGLRFLDSAGSGVEIVSAEKSPALLAADFICGHGRYAVLHEGFDNAVVLLAAKGIALYGFETSPTRKRVQLALSNRDYSEALFQVMQEDLVDQKPLEHLLAELLGNTNETNIRFEIDALINKLDHWSCGVDKSSYIKALQLLDHAFDASLKSDEEGYSIPLALEAARFRLKAYLLIWANHLGDSDLAEGLSMQLSHMRDRVSNDPMTAESVFQLEVELVEQAINDHRFEEAERLSGAHLASLRMVTGFGTSSGTPDSTQRTNARGVCVELRSGALSASSVDDSDKLKLVWELARNEAVALSVTDKVQLASTEDDLIRFLQIEAYCAETLYDKGALGDLLQRLLHLLQGNPSRIPYGTAVMVRTLATLSLIGNDPVEIGEPLSGSLDELVISALDDGLSHPFEIIAREWLLWAHRSARLSSDTQQHVCEELVQWAGSLRPTSEVFRHQARLARVIAKYVRGQAIQEGLSEVEEMRAMRLKAAAIGAHESQVLAIRATTIY